MISPIPPSGFIPVMLLKQGPWVATEGDVLSQQSLLLDKTLGRDVKFWGSSGASQLPLLATPV